MTRLTYLKTLLVDSALAHAMKFTAPLSPAYGNAFGNRILLAFVIVGIGIFLCLRFALQLTELSGIPEANFCFVISLLAAFLITQNNFIKLPTSDIGLRTLAKWTRRERLYLFQVLPLAALVFAVLFREHLFKLVEQHGVFRFMLFTVFTGVLWGFIQELMYRGWLQTELTRRFGPLLGILASNLIFTVGPLHLNLFTGSDGPQWNVIAAVFGIGLFFGVLYQRSGNLWIPALLHGLWPLNMS